LGGGVFVNGGTLRVVNSTFTGCSATGGAGGGGTAVAGMGLGGAIFQRNGSVTLLFSTLAFNSVSSPTGTPASEDGGALYTLGDSTASSDGSGGPTATLSVDSAILSNSVTAANDFVKNTNGGGASVTIASSNVNVVVHQTPAATLNVIAGNADPQLSVLASNGGPTETFSLKTGSPAIGAGDTTIESTAPPAGPGGVDERGFPRRSGVTDVGAFEQQAGSIAVVSGGGQSAAAGAVFASTIVFQVSDENGNPLEGATLTLTPPASGASATFSTGPFVTALNGQVSVTATANSTVGSAYTVTATAGSVSAGVKTTTFQLTNGSATSPPPSPSPSPGPSPSPSPSPSPTPTPQPGSSPSQFSGGGSGGGSGGCQLGPIGGSPFALTPLVLVFAACVVRRRRRI
jgi:hypothetical protein